MTMSPATTPRCVRRPPIPGDRHLRALDPRECGDTALACVPAAADSTQPEAPYPDHSPRARSTVPEGGVHSLISEHRHPRVPPARIARTMAHPQTQRERTCTFEQARYSPRSRWCSRSQGARGPRRPRLPRHRRVRRPRPPPRHPPRRRRRRSTSINYWYWQDDVTDPTIQQPGQPVRTALRHQGQHPGLDRAAATSTRA